VHQGRFLELPELGGQAQNDKAIHDEVLAPAIRPRVKLSYPLELNLTFWEPTYPRPKFEIHGSDLFFARKARTA
jgi:hypothetical protein